jgi:digeranylgeranylglycerophospholipid reductase
MEKGSVKGVIVQHNRSETRIRSDVVIAADGLSSLVAKKSGLGCIKRFCVCKRYVARGCRVESNRYMELLTLGNDFTPGGGAWIYPYSESIIDFGFGVLNTKMKRGLNFYASKFMENPIIRKKNRGRENH